MVAMRSISYIGNWLTSWLGGGEGWFNHDHSDKMTADRALSYPPVWHCVSKISGAFMIMPLNLYQSKGRDINRVTNHASYQLLRWRPNAYQTPSQWKRLMLTHALLWGNARSYIVRSGRTPVELIPLLPDRTATMLMEGEKWHVTLINRDDRLSLFVDMEQKQEQVIWMQDKDVWHVPGLGCDGIEGKSLIALAKQSWGIGLNAEKQIAKMQKKGYAGGLKIEIPAGQLRDEAEAKKFHDNLKKRIAGVDSEDAILMLREGMKAEVMQMSNQDAQFIDQRRFQREDAALLFLLEGILGDNSNASFASLEQRNLAYRLNCLAPWTTAIEEESDLKLLTDSDRKNEYYHKFNDGALLRTEKAAAMSFISRGITSRVLNPNEGRAMLELNPYDGGDEYVNPNTMTRKPDNGTGGASNQPADPAKTAANKAVSNHLGHLFHTEGNRVSAGAKVASNFIEWMDNFYGKNWESMLADNMEAIGLDRELATTHCTESKRRLLEVCDYSTQENLAENVAKCVSNWKTRANNIGVENV